MLNRIVRVVVVLGIGVLLASSALAQQATSGIAGVVRDTSGGILPGVTVEAASPALIEKVRTAVTDGEGRYNLVALQPGTYTVTFSLPGFNTLRREGVVITAGFTAQVNADLPVGTLEETLTVTGEAPLVDAQNTRQQSRVSSEMLSLLPSSKAAVSAVIALTPGVVGQADVGGSGGVWVASGTSNTITFHGKSGLNMNYDGFGIVGVLGNGTTGYLTNPLMVSEMVVEKGGGTAEVNTSTLTMNAVPREGSNTFSTTISGNYSSHHLQSSNLTDDLRARGVNSIDSARYLYNVGGSVGGPIRTDRLWFMGSLSALGNYNHVSNNYYNKTQGTPFYTPDLTRPADQTDQSERYAIRTTWQATQRDKVNLGYELQFINEQKRRISGAPEAFINYRHKSGIAQATWTAPMTNKLLLEAGGSVMFFNFPTFPQPENTDPLNTISILEQSTNYRYNSQAAFTKPEHNERRAQRFSASYVTGSHAFKVGAQLEQHLRNNCQGCNGPQPHISYTFNRGVPVSITQNATPYLNQNRTKLEMGLFAQDQWTINRLTLSYGVRFDYFNGYIPEQTIAATRFIAERHFDKVENAPNWSDVSPRFGVAYDLFGNGRTALKASAGRYLVKETVSLNNALNPLATSVNTVNRTWTDADQDYVPDCDLTVFTANGECAAINNANFGRNVSTTRYADDVLTGFGVRPSNWDFSAEIQHQLTQNMSVTAGWYRSDFTHLNARSSVGTDVGITPPAAAAALTRTIYAADNVLVSPADYDPFCITAPRDPRLPGGGGYQICGLYDINPAKFGQVQTVVKQPSEFGDPVQQSDFFSVNLSTRFGNGALLSGGVDTGRTVEDNCYVIDSPQALLNCRIAPPWSALTQVKVQGSYPLPRDISVSAVLQNVAGPQYVADYNATNAEIAPSLGRNLAACGTRTPCTATVPVPLLPSGEYYEPRRTQLDVRVSKTFALGPRMRLQANLDVFNALNADSVLNIINTYGPAWRQTSAAGTGATSLGVLGARLAQFSAELRF